MLESLADTRLKAGAFFAGRQRVGRAVSRMRQETGVDMRPEWVLSIIKQYESHLYHEKPERWFKEFLVLN